MARGGRHSQQKNTRHASDADGGLPSVTGYACLSQSLRRPARITLLFCGVVCAALRGTQLKTAPFNLNAATRELHLKEEWNPSLTT